MSEEETTAVPGAPETSETSAPDAEVHVPVETQETVEVGLVRTVRYGAILVGGAALFALIGFVASFFYPVEEDADYTVGQVAGYMIVVGAAIGLGVAAVVALILSRIAKRRTGSALVVHTTVS